MGYLIKSIHRAVHLCKYGAVDKYRVALFSIYSILDSHMDTREAGRRGALITNTKLTTEGRRKAAKKVWKLRKKRLARL